MLGKITLRGTSNIEERYTYLLTDAAITNENKADYIGRAVELDTSADCAVKLATDGGVIYGRILTIEVEMTGEKVAAIETLGGLQLPVAEGATLTRGTIPVGAGDGFIKDAEATGGGSGDDEEAGAAAVAPTTGRGIVVDTSSIAVDQTATVMFH